MNESSSQLKHFTREFFVRPFSINLDGLEEIIPCKIISFKNSGMNNNPMFVR